MTASEPAVLTQAQLRTLNSFADVLTPGGAGFPTPTGADPDGSVLTLALHHMRHAIGEVAAALDEAAGLDCAAFLADLERTDPQRFETIRTLLVARYLTCRPVWDALGYPGHRPAPARPGEAEEYLRDEILSAVIGRGKIHQPIPIEG